MNRSLDGSWCDAGQMTRRATVFARAEVTRIVIEALAAGQQLANCGLTEKQRRTGERVREPIGAGKTDNRRQTCGRKKSAQGRFF
ncbi:MAG TPA: hypothetical protein VF573_14965 [Paraburkholderia sp.]|uniref:hypothetical protein n=1 Tax=Paraburkholderia sp. TaxID=1926495 RepID=UPI002ED56644